MFTHMVFLFPADDNIREETDHHWWGGQGAGLGMEKPQGESLWMVGWKMSPRGRGRGV